jgi:hypothetical protein
MNVFRAHILVCHGTNCGLKAPQAILKALQAALSEHGLEGEAKIVETGCFSVNRARPWLCSRMARSTRALSPRMRGKSCPSTY